MKYPIELADVSLSFAQFRALDQLNLRVAEGEIHGFLGPKGAGKSTTIRALLGLLHPTGTVRVLGQDPRSNPEVLRHVGYVPGDVTLWPQLTGRETLTALAKLRVREVDAQREQELIDAFQLDPYKKCRDYSTGNRRKVLLVSAFLRRRNCLFWTNPPRVWIH
ncbi:ATP-binding cassette domain-containing protein [Corynebacterium epidermidicanis]|uniref:ABC transporter n=1 Tax=Corynebacterium epidermidicanis TaxID=1050174 RepID=A0A0G3GT30_9CORY|nr:ABC transporter ATP-binding protein [Corynebacterium epidermidicanis]AKK04336.1 ABC transporter [Corynebacterium epidermidicanis]